MNAARSGLFVVVAVACGLVLGGCSPVTVGDYTGNEPKLVAEDFFDGRLRAHGVVKNRGGKVIRYFSADIDASWVDGVGTLDERFLFDDGEQQTRIWTLRPTAPDRYLATAGDVVGEGELEISGNSLFLDYVLRVPYGDDSIDLRIDDRMYLVSERVLLNESIMTKWGIEVASVMLVIEKL